MAKIVDITMSHMPDVIIIGDDNSDVTAHISIEFHDLDLQLHMEYMLYFFIYDVHGKLDVPVIISNWDESKLFSLAVEDSSDEFLGLHKQHIRAEEKEVHITTEITLKLGILNRQKSHYSKKLETLAILIPAIGRVSKWSRAYNSKIDY